MTQYIQCQHHKKYVLTFAPNGSVSHQRCTCCKAMRYAKSDGTFWMWTGSRKVKRLPWGNRYKKAISFPQALETMTNLLLGGKNLGK